MLPNNYNRDNGNEHLSLSGAYTMAQPIETLLADASKVFVADITPVKGLDPAKKYILVVDNYVCGAYYVSERRSVLGWKTLVMNNITEHSKEVGKYVSFMISDQIELVGVTYHRKHFEDGICMMTDNHNMFSRINIIKTINSLVTRSAYESEASRLAIMMLALLGKAIS